MLKKLTTIELLILTKYSSENSISINLYDLVHIGGWTPSTS